MPSLLNVLAAATLAFCSLAAYATPKAAEYEDAPVTIGADVARPKPSAKLIKLKPTVKTIRAAKGKPTHPARQRTKTAHARK